MRKSSSSNSLTTSSSGYGSAVGSLKGAASSLPATALARRGSTEDWKGGAANRSLRGKGLGPNMAALNADTTAQRVKNLHSARALSKLNNNMDV
jgi:hypothetical protein